MKAIILAAGYATRLYPLTQDFPKPLLKVKKKEILKYILENVEKVSEIDEIFIVTNNRFFKHFNDWVKNYNTTKKINTVNDQTLSNEGRLGAIGDITFVLNKYKIKDNILVVAGDNLFKFSLNELIRLFKEKKTSIVAARYIQDKTKLANKFGVIMADENQKIIDFEEKPSEPRSNLASTCCYLFSKNDLIEFENCIKENKKPDNTGDFIKYLSNKKDIYCYIFDSEWFDIGSLEGLKEAEENF